MQDRRVKKARRVVHPTEARLVELFLVTVAKLICALISISFYNS